MHPVTRTFNALAVLMVMGLSLTANAHASEADWTIGSETLTELSLAEESVSVAGGSFVLSLPKGTIECKTATGSGAILKGGPENLKFSLLECVLSGLAACKVSKTINLEAKANWILAGGNVYEKVEPQKEGGALATIEFSGAECALGSLKLVGTVAAAISLEDLEEQSLKFSTEISKNVNQALKEAGKSELGLFLGPTKMAVSVSGTLSTKLSGKENAGEEFAFALSSKLCEVASGDNVCPVNKNFGMGTAFALANEVKIKASFNDGTANQTFVCDNSAMSGTLSQNSGDPMLIGSLTAFTFTNCGVCVLETTASSTTPYSVEFKSGGIENNVHRGLMRVRFPRFKVKCNGGAVCEYQADHMTFLSFGGAPATIKRGWYPVIRVAGPCIGLLELEKEGGGDFSYKFTSPASGTLYPSF